MLLELLDVSRDSVSPPETSRSNFSSAHRCCHPDTLTRESLLVYRRPPSTKIRQSDELRAAGTNQVPAYAFHSQRNRNPSQAPRSKVGTKLITLSLIQGQIQVSIPSLNLAEDTPCLFMKLTGRQT